MSSISVALCVTFFIVLASLQQSNACRLCAYAGCSTTCNYGTSNLVTTEIRNCPTTRACFSQCCASQYHCSGTQKCIADSLHCNYDDDCGDKQDELGCSTPCTIHYTSFSSDGNGEAIYLDRHVPDCGSTGHKVLRHFQMQRNSAGNQIRYMYTCCALYSAVCTNQLKHAPLTTESNQIFSLDKQHVTCGDHGFLRSHDLNRDHQGKYRYDYNCCVLNNQKHKDRTVCVTETTSYSDGGTGKNHYLDRHSVACSQEGYYISSFKLERNPAQNTQIRYSYRCCTIQI